MNDVADQEETLALARAYRGRSPGVFDELIDHEGHVRGHWRKLLTLLGALDGAQLARRAENARHLVHENGVSYDVYGETPGLAHPWTLSLVPALISPDDWSTLSRGIAQRARLFRAVLADWYGPQRTMIERVVPPELVFRHPSFVLPLSRMRVPSDNWMPLYAADVVRSPDGRFFTLEDRTQMPSGAGYALENRIVIASALPDLIRECNVERLALFFRTVRDSLAAAAPHNRDNPRIVLLTAGPNDPTYFEHAYLAQYLGLTLVSGGDLTVRDERVYLKMLGGLLPVDVILRRVADDCCDPLELRADSPLGVPGLVQAMRAGNIAVVNPLGSGVAQTSALLPYLPALCRRLLSEELLLESVPSFWCGDRAMLDEVAARFDQLVIKPAFPDGARPVLTSELTEAQRTELLAQIRAQPWRWSAHENVQPSTTPAMLDGALVPHSLVARFFAASHTGGEYAVMPGGLARAGETSADVSMRLGGGSKDVWVVSSEAPTGPSVKARTTSALELSRGGGDLPSRAADDLYWLGRYAERAEAVARLARVAGARLADLANESELERSTEIGPLLAALSAQTQFLYTADIPEVAARNLGDCDALLIAAVFDAQCPGSLRSVVRATLRAGRLIRDRISSDTWRVLATLEDDLQALAETEGPDRLHTTVSLLHHLVITLAAFSGLAMESMTRGHAWRFLDMGRRLERAIALGTLLRATLGRAGDREGTLLEAVLTVADSMMTYRRRYLASLQTAPVVDLLLTDDTNPRSVIFQVRALADHVRALPLLPGSGVRSPQLRLALATLNEIELAEVEKLCATSDGQRPALDAFLRRLGELLPAISESLSNSYLNHATVSRHLGQDA